MLTDLRIKKEKPREKSFKVSDGGGLYLFVSPSGGKLWRFKYLFGGKEKLLSLGPYPDISLLAARSARDDAQSHVAIWPRSVHQQEAAKARRDHRNG